MTAMSVYDTDLDKVPANYQSLSPIGFLERAAKVYPNQLAVIHGPIRINYDALYARSRRLASALVRAGVGKNDTVAVMAPNVPALLEAHYGVPMTGGVLNALNIRLDAATIAFTRPPKRARILGRSSRSSSISIGLSISRPRPSALRAPIAIARPIR